MCADEVRIPSAAEAMLRMPRYPLSFEELTYGEVLVSMSLVPVADAQLPANLTIPDMDSMVQYVHAAGSGRLIRMIV